VADGIALPPPFTLTLAPGVEMAFVWIPPGEFVMGERGQYPDEEPRHRVRITQGFHLGATPVTQAQFGVWTSALAKRGKVPPDGAHENDFKGPPAHPAENVSWRDSAMYCAWLTARFGDAAAAPGTTPANGRLGRHVATLPTEAEWEYACRAGTTTEYWSGDGEAALRAVGWFDGNAEGSTQPVRRLTPNPWGLYDVHGNVREWCWDLWDTAAYAQRPDGVPDPGHAVRAGWWAQYGADPATGLPGAGDPVRVLRGGSWGRPGRVLPVGVSLQEEPWQPRLDPGLSCLSGSRSACQPGGSAGRRSPAGRRGAVWRRVARADGLRLGQPPPSALAT
jgi:formylglycine-generating enzyme required for sulfatase activity